MSLSDELQIIVQEESCSFFASIQPVSGVKEDSILAYGYAFYLLETSAQHIASSFHIPLDNTITSIHAQFTQCINQWVSSLLTPSSHLTPFFQSIRWSMRDQGRSL